MAELGIGVLFAIMFVAAYLFVSRFARKGTHVCGRRLKMFEKNFNSGRSLDEKRPRHFLTAYEMGEHHSRSGEGRSK